MKRQTVRTSLDIPALLHRQLHETAARRSCSVRALILRSIEREIANDPGMKKRIHLPLVPEDGETINPTNEEIYNVLFS
jgi:hypothetical protein